MRGGNERRERESLMGWENHPDYSFVGLNCEV